MIDEKTTVLYLKIAQPQGMKFSPVDPLTNLVNKDVKKGGVIILLFPKEPTDVPSKIAAVLLKQNPHLISTEPYKEKDDVRIKTRKDGEKTRNEFEAKRMMETTEQRAKANARFIKVSATSAARIKQKVRPSHDPGLLYGGDRNAINDKGEDEKKDDVMKFVEPLSEFAEVDRENVTREQLRHFAKTLEVKLGKKSARDSILAVLDERSVKLTHRIKAVMDRTKKADAAYALKIGQIESEIPKPSHFSGLLPQTGEDTVIEQGAEEPNMEKEAESVLALDEEIEGENPKK